MATKKTEATEALKNMALLASPAAPQVANYIHSRSRPSAASTRYGL
jgi:hypothetical protein